MDTKRSNRSVGDLGERLGAEFLKDRGYKILDKNVRSPFGEIDLVAEHNGTLVFIEVKARRSGAFGLPEEAMTQSKKRRLGRLGSWYAARLRRWSKPVRFDLLAVELGGGHPKIRLIQNAFEVDSDGF